MSAKKSKLTAVSLRKFMTFAIFLIIVLSAVGFYFAQDWIGKYAAQVDQTTSGSSVSGSSPQALTKIQEEITENQASGNKASSLIASSQDPQSQVIKDLNKYASATGISIAGYNLSQPATAGINASATIPGLKSSFITITLNNPIPMKKLLQFFKLVENNLPKMQITGINISSPSASGDDVTIDPLTIEVFTK